MADEYDLSSTISSGERPRERTLGKEGCFVPHLSLEESGAKRGVSSYTPSRLAGLRNEREASLAFTAVAA